MALVMVPKGNIRYYVLYDEDFVPMYIRGEESRRPINFSDNIVAMMRVRDHDPRTPSWVPQRSSTPRLEVVMDRSCTTSSCRRRDG